MRILLQFPRTENNLIPGSYYSMKGNASMNAFKSLAKTAIILLAFNALFLFFGALFVLEHAAHAVGYDVTFQSPIALHELVQAHDGKLARR